jgi:deoxyribodipyrimidine photolyase-related protein
MSIRHSRRALESFPDLKADGPVARLALVLGDQLDAKAKALTELDRQADAVVMFEVASESMHVTSHKQRTALFLSAMRHFALELHEVGFRVHYLTLDDSDNTQSLGSELQRAIQNLKPERVTCTQPGEWRVLEELQSAAEQSHMELEILPDEHFLTSRDAFSDWMKGRKQPVMEHFYRMQRRELNLLIQSDGNPVGGEWNFDQDNRSPLSDRPKTRKPYQPRIDAITREVLTLVEDQFPDHPGSLESFRWPVTRAQAQRVLKDFIEHRLATFGPYQDAMWIDQPFLYHSLLSPALNLKLLNPRECVEAAVDAYESKAAPINSVEGFVRQIIGWREFIRGIYWHQGSDYGRRNQLQENGRLPVFYWSGQTDMFCMRQCLNQVLEHGYGHHIQRLMVTGNFALIAGVDPKVISDWYLAMYVDAVDWVTLPNTLGMVMHADGGVVGTKPYAASGRYIQRMSNYCKQCQFDPARRSGPDACPFTVFYWDFLIRHQRRFQNNHRMAMILKNVDRLDPDQRRTIRDQAVQLRTDFQIEQG